MGSSEPSSGECSLLFLYVLFAKLGITHHQSPRSFEQARFELIHHDRIRSHHRSHDLWRAGVEARPVHTRLFRFSAGVPTTSPLVPRGLCRGPQGHPRAAVRPRPPRLFLPESHRDAPRRQPPSFHRVPAGGSAQATSCYRSLSSGRISRRLHALQQGLAPLRDTRKCTDHRNFTPSIHLSYEIGLSGGLC